MRLLITLGLLAGCGVDPREECKATAAVTCKKLFECWTSGADHARLMLGASAADCTTTAQARCEPPAALCPSPTTWDSPAAAQCSSEYEATSCSALRMGATPSVCSNTCK